MARKQLTKKQLYGYSYMKWAKIRRIVLSNFIMGKCSFCHDADNTLIKKGILTRVDTCKHCQIDKNLCSDNGTSGLFAEIDKIDNKLFSLVSEMCERLLGAYYDAE